MKSLQWIEILLFSALVCFFGCSALNSIGCFLSAVFLLFYLNYSACLIKTKFICSDSPEKQNTKTISKDENIEQEKPTSDDCEFADEKDQEIGGNKQFLRISQENIAYCMILYRLRIVEVIRSYSEICMNYPSSKEEDPWVLKLLKDCAKYEGSYYDYEM